MPLVQQIYDALGPDKLNTLTQDLPHHVETLRA